MGLGGIVFKLIFGYFQYSYFWLFFDYIDLMACHGFQKNQIFHLLCLQSQQNQTKTYNVSILGQQILVSNAVLGLLSLLISSGAIHNTHFLLVFFPAKTINSVWKVHGVVRFRLIQPKLDLNLTTPLEITGIKKKCGDQNIVCYTPSFWPHHLLFWEEKPFFGYFWYISTLSYA